MGNRLGCDRCEQVCNSIYHGSSSNLECDETRSKFIDGLVSKCGTIPGWRNVGTCSRPWCSSFVICHGTSFSTAV